MVTFSSMDESERGMSTPETGFLNEQRLAKKWLTEL